MEKVIINDYIRGESLAEENIDDVLDLVNKIRFSRPQKSIWLYSGYTWEEIIKGNMEDGLKYSEWTKRAKIIAECDVIVDGQYVEPKRDITLPYCGFKNQRVIDVKKSLQSGEVILWCN